MQWGRDSEGVSKICENAGAREKKKVSGNCRTVKEKKIKVLQSFQLEHVMKTICERNERIKNCFHSFFFSILPREKKWFFCVCGADVRKWCERNSDGHWRKLLRKSKSNTTETGFSECVNSTTTATTSYASVVLPSFVHQDHLRGGRWSCWPRTRTWGRLRQRLCGHSTTTICRTHTKTYGNNLTFNLLKKKCQSLYFHSWSFTFWFVEVTLQFIPKKKTMQRSMSLIRLEMAATRVWRHYFTTPSWYRTLWSNLFPNIKSSKSNMIWKKETNSTRTWTAVSSKCLFSYEIFVFATTDRNTLSFLYQMTRIIKEN